MLPDQSPRPANLHVHLIWAAVLIVAGLISFAIYKISLDAASNAADRLIEEAKGTANAAIKKAEDYAEAAARAAQRVAEKFNTGTITQTFQAEVPVFQSAGVGRLEVGTSEATETFKESDVRATLWDWVYLGETVAEIKVPVTYRYHVDLNDNWKLSVNQNNCIVHVPILKPSLPVAIHTDKMEKRASEGWARFDGTEKLDALQKTITPKLNENAASKEHMGNVREEARNVIARFIRAWLMREDQWRQDKLSSVTVLFEDELQNGSPLPATLTIE